MAYDVYVAILTILIVSSGTAIKFQKKVVCYYASWTVYRAQYFGYLDINAIPTDLCSHVVYAFIGMNSSGQVQILDTYADIDRGGFNKIVNLKASSPTLKVYVALGGTGLGSASLDEVMLNPNSRSTAVTSILNFLNQYDFDGININWMSPTANDRNNFALFLTELRKTSRRNYKLLSVTLGSVDISVLQASYDFKNLVNNTNWIGISTYNYHQASTGKTGHNAPLFSSGGGPSVDKTITSLINAGIPPSKLVMGVPLYGKSFTLSTPILNQGMGQTIVSAGSPGPYSKTPGFLDNTEVCDMIARGADVVRTDYTIVASYMLQGNQWVSYDSEIIARYKGSYASTKRLAGVMVWELTNDSPEGIEPCSSFFTLRALVCGFMECPNQGIWPDNHYCQIWYPP